MLIGCAFYLVSNDQLVDIYYRKYPEYAEVYKIYLKNTDDPKTKAKLEQLEHEIWGLYPTKKE